MTHQLLNLETVVFVFVFATAYTWAGYPVLLWLLRSVLRSDFHRSSFQPSVSIIVAVYNEESRIAAKLEDCLALEYPQGSLEILIASDGSTDATEDIVRKFVGRDPRIRLLRSAGRAGKSAVQNLAAEQAKGEILLFTDAETRIPAPALSLIAENFADDRVGLIAPVVRFGSFQSSVSAGQGSYWRFEILLRQLESDVGILATASGSALAVRRSLYRALPSEYGDDCVIPLDVRLQGRAVVQDARAVVYDEMPHSIEGELRTRVRMTARNWSGTLHRPGLLNPLRFPGIAWSLISHKFLRWMTPFFLAALLLASGGLALEGRFTFFFVLQLGFYCAAIIGWRRSRREYSGRLFGYPFAFCLANLGFFLGVVRSLRGQRVVAYK